MVSEKPWKLEAVMLLGIGVLLGLSLGTLLGQTVQRFWPQGIPWDESFYHFILNSVSFHGVALVLLGFFLKQHQLGWREFLGLNPVRLGRVLGWALLVSVVVLPSTLALNKLSYYLMSLLSDAPEMQITVRLLRQSVTLGQKISFAVAAMVLAPVVEETLFRGILYPLLKQQGFPRLAWWGTSLLFAVIHCNAVTFVPLTFLALALIWLYEKTDSLLAPIIAHALFNAVNFFLLVYEATLDEWGNHLLRGLGL